MDPSTHAPHAAVELDPWHPPADAFPYDGSAADQLAFAARWAVLAPSSHNAQPWLFVVRRDHLELVADRTRALPVSDPDDRELTLSCGAALHSLCVALAQFGWRARVELLPDGDDPDLLAAVWLGEPAGWSAEVERLFRAIPLRHTNRGPFAPAPPPADVVARLAVAARLEDAWLAPADAPARQRLAALVAEGDRAQMHDRSFRRELAAWLHPNRNAGGDGMPGYAHGWSNLRSYVGPLVVRTFDVGDGTAARDHEIAARAPLLCVLGSDGDGTRDWIAAGRALGRVLLEATAAGLAASFLNQPIEVPRLRAEVAAAVGRSGVAQLVLRLGHGGPVAPTPRRPLWQVLHRFD